MKRSTIIARRGKKTRSPYAKGLKSAYSYPAWARTRGMLPPKEIRAALLANIYAVSEGSRPLIPRSLLQQEEPDHV